MEDLWDPVRHLLCISYSSSHEKKNGSISVAHVFRGIRGPEPHSQWKSEMDSTLYKIDDTHSSLNQGWRVPTDTGMNYYGFGEGPVEKARI